MSDKEVTVAKPASASGAEQLTPADREAKAKENFEAACVKTKPLVEKANATFTKGYNFTSKTASTSGGAKPLEISKSDLIVAYNDKVGRFWAWFAPFGSALWYQMSQEAREAFILSYPINIPAKHGDEGEEGGQKGISLICPEINLQLLSSPRGLPNVFNSRLLEDQDQELRDSQVIHPLVKAGKLSGTQEDAHLTYTFLAGEGRGLWYKADDMKQIEGNKVFTEAIDKGLMVDGHTFEIMQVRRLEVLRLLAFYVDVLRQEVFEHDPEYAKLRKSHCFTCGKSAEKDTKLLACGRCRDAYYCSADCQKNHWRVHKVFCGGDKEVKTALPRVDEVKVNASA
eukprot:comp17802_c0_seq1/m.17874 comp17802_c0_seq1/g.17874  ORF comp17802_c0_seq1/g.17874 comp17802_c0_seq1/m.17874 type:complete len:341 (-) comp17802_c0_seq1:469-1491(-)